MCEYCNAEENGDINYTPIIPFDGDGLHSVVGVNANAKALCANVFYNTTDLGFREAKINYCPMCGREL